MGRASHNVSTCVLYSYFGCDIRCGVCNGAIPVDPSSRFRSLGHIVTTLNNGTHQVAIVVPVLCRNERREEATERSVSYTVTLRRLITVNIGGVVAFSTRSPHIGGTVPLRNFSGMRTTCRVVGTLLHAIPSVGLSERRAVVMSPSRNNVKHYVCCSSILKLRLNVFCGHHGCSIIMGNEGPVRTRRFLNGSVANGSLVLISSVVSSNRSVLSVTTGLGRGNTNEVFVFSAFNLFIRKLRGFSRCCRGNLVSGIFAAGLVCRAPRLLSHR